jgi:hypothetical protein
VHKTIPASFTNANCLPPIFIKSILLRVQAPALPPPLPPCQQPLAHPKSSRNLRGMLSLFSSNIQTLRSWIIFNTPLRGALFSTRLTGIRPSTPKKTIETF